MRSHLAFFVFALLSLLVTLETAKAAVPACNPNTTICLGQPCNKGVADKVGVTTMDFDNKNLIACLKNSAGTDYTWKAMTGDNIPKGTLCGLAVYFVPLGGAGGGGATYNSVPCDTIAFGNTVNGASVSCPSGYTFVTIGAYEDATGRGNYYSCAKN